MTSGKTWVKDGPEAATMVKADPAFALNDFYTKSGASDELTLVSAKRNQGGFISIAKSLNENEALRSTFEVDMLINGTTYIEADPEKNIDADYLIIKGAVFDFRNAIMPVEFVVKDPNGIKYFESLDASASNPTFTKVWGTINSSTIVTRKEEESAFGEPSIKEYTRTIREWLVTGTSKPDLVYPIGDAEAGITVEDIKKAMADREVYLAGVKQRQDEYQASKNAGTASNVASAPAAVGGFNF
jgi:hypothetical protein